MALPQVKHHEERFHVDNERNEDMKNLQAAIIGMALILGATVQSFAVENLQVSIQSSNVVLSWPSNPWELYIIQYRPTLDPTNGWQQLTNQYPADTSGSNITYFTHTNGVNYASWTTNSGSSGSGTNTGPGGLMPPVPGGGGPSGPSTNNLIGLPGFGYYQVVREGVYIVGQTNLTNQPLSDVITLSLEAGNDTGILSEALVQADGLNFAGSTPIFAPPTAPWNLSVDTAYLENGTHTLQVEVQWFNPDISDVNNSFLDSMSDPVAITVSNQVSYPNWEPEIGTNSAYFLETVYTNATYQLDIYDSTNNLVQTLTGHATNGLIEAYWDMQDTNGVSRTDSDTDPFFNATITVMPSGLPQVQKATPQKKQRPINYPTQGGWVIAYQDNFSYMLNSNLYYGAIYDMGSLGANFGGSYTKLPHAPGQPDTGQTWPMRYPYTNAAVPTVTVPMMILDKNALRALLTNSNMRNFYYNGHGAAQGIASMFSSAEIASYVRHYYRFVFLDACLAANGDNAKAFGIPYNKPMPLSYFTKTGLRPRTFLGYPITVHYAQGGTFSDANGNVFDFKVPESVPDFLNNFEFYWDFNYDITSAIYYAIQDTPYIGSGWETGQDLKLYGYDSLGVNSYNYGSDWNN